MRKTKNPPISDPRSSARPPEPGKRTASLKNSFAVFAFFLCVIMFVSIKIQTQPYILLISLLISQAPAASSYILFHSQLEFRLVNLSQNDRLNLSFVKNVHIMARNSPIMKLHVIFKSLTTTLLFFIEHKLSLRSQTAITQESGRYYTSFCFSFCVLNIPLKKQIIPPP